MESTKTTRTTVSPTAGDAVASPRLGQRSSCQQGSQGCAVHVTMHQKLEYGQVLKLVGSCKEMGQWQVEKANSMHWQEGDIWVATMQLAPGTYAFKAVVASSSGAMEPHWEAGFNRQLEVPEEAGRLNVVFQWESNSMTTTFFPGRQAQDNGG
ncbi:CBM20 domain-containing protein [Haematococcus lacustris]|uniref:CBM20 domain-containing protein n=1 Tax=Haematococcus lacustris TaxID=44745 RepID=A0A699YKG2_HAELA|nr:CBM20 domain-containing protein [Haematococcus lacustris]